jgi:hypothetical protein
MPVSISVNGEQHLTEEGQTVLDSWAAGDAIGLGVLRQNL